MKLMRRIAAVLAVTLLAVTSVAVTNLVVVVTLSDAQHTNLVAIAAERGQTPEQYLRGTNMGLAAEFNREHDNIRLRLLLQLWEAATPDKRAAAIEALR